MDNETYFKIETKDRGTIYFKWIVPVNKRDPHQSSNADFIELTEEKYLEQLKLQDAKI